MFKHPHSYRMYSVNQCQGYVLGPVLDQKTLSLILFIVPSVPSFPEYPLQKGQSLLDKLMEL